MMDRTEKPNRKQNPNCVLKCLKHSLLDLSSLFYVHEGLVCIARAPGALRGQKSTGSPGTRVVGGVSLCRERNPGPLAASALLNHRAIFKQFLKGRIYKDWGS